LVTGVRKKKLFVLWRLVMVAAMFTSLRAGLAVGPRHPSKGDEVMSSNFDKWLPLTQGPLRG